MAVIQWLLLIRGFEDIDKSFIIGKTRLEPLQKSYLGYWAGSEEDKYKTKNISKAKYNVSSGLSVCIYHLSFWHGSL